MNSNSKGKKKMVNFEEFLSNSNKIKNNTNFDLFYYLDHIQNSKLPVNEIEKTFKERIDTFEENKSAFINNIKKSNVK